MSKKTTPQEPDTEIDFKDDPVKNEILECAKHALIMEFRSERGFDPSADELAQWASTFIQDTKRVKSIIERRNRSILMFTGKYPDFWAHLAGKIEAA